MRSPAASRAAAAISSLLLGVPWRRVHTLAPGLLLAAGVMAVAHALAGALGSLLFATPGARPLSGIMVAIVLGATLANTVGTPVWLTPGLDLSVKKVLRLGIILVGIKLSMVEVLSLGAWGLPVIFVVIVVALAVTPWLARRIGVSARLGILAAASTAICGVTAALAIAPAIDAEDEEVAYTIANVTLFGLLAMLIYPYIAHGLFAAQPRAAGLFLGTGIHDTSQVMGAALVYEELFHDDLPLKVAAVTKLTRNLFLAVVVPFLAVAHARRTAGPRRRVPFAKVFPAFVVAFVLMAVLRTLGDAGVAGEAGRALGVWDAAGWRALTKTVGDGWAYFALGTAMAGVGLSTRLAAFRGMGLRPLYVGACAAVIVGVLSLALAALVGLTR